MGSRRRGLKVYTFGVIILGLAVAAYSIADLIKHPVGLRWLVLVALTVASGWAMLRIPAWPISFSISDTFIIAAALVFGPSAGANSSKIFIAIVFLSSGAELSGRRPAG